MKKIFAILAILIPALTACVDQHHLLTYSELPAQAQTFIQKYFNPSDISCVERERDGLHYDYTVHVARTTKIEFDYQGYLESVDCEVHPVPDGIVPDLIVSFVVLHYPNQFIVEYLVGKRHLMVELGNGLELIFDHEGHFIRVDD